MEIVFDARSLRLYPVGRPGFSGGTEGMVHRLSAGLAGLGHTVHVVTPDLDRMERRDNGLFYWGPTNAPTKADTVVLVHSLEFVRDYDCAHYVFATNGVDCWAGPSGQWAAAIDAFPVFSNVHRDLMVARNKHIDPAKCHVTGLGVDVDQYLLEPNKTPARLFFSNDPARGLWHLLDIFDELKKLVPDATLAIGYDFEAQFNRVKWESSAMGQAFWDMDERIKATLGIINLGALTPDQVRAEQLRASLHVHPSEPPNVGSQIHGLTQAECAAASVPLILSDVEAFPEVFGGVAEILPVPGTWFPDAGRVTPKDWANVCADYLTDTEKWLLASRESRAWAEQHTWSRVLDNWDVMLSSLATSPIADKAAGEAVMV